MIPTIFSASCAVGHPDCVDMQPVSDTTDVFIIAVLGIAVVLIALAAWWWRRGR
jgi:hypothetical protein